MTRSLRKFPPFHPVTVLLALALSPVILAAPDVQTRINLQNGDRVGVKGSFQPNGTFLARKIEKRPGQGDDMEIRGRIRNVLLERGTLDILEFHARITAGTRIVDESGNVLSLEALQDGLRIKAYVGSRVDDVLLLNKIKIRENQEYDESRFVGTVESLVAPGGRPAYFRLLGVTVRTDRRTTYEGFKESLSPSLGRRPGYFNDDDDLRFLEDGGRKRRVVIAGEMRFRIETIRNRTGDQDDDPESRGRVFGLLGAAVEIGPIFAYSELLAEKDYILESEQSLLEGESSVRVDQLYFELPIPWVSNLAVAIGRQKFGEEREWYYETKNLDAVRVLGAWKRISAELSVSRSLFNQSRNHVDQNLRNLIFTAHYQPAKPLNLDLFYIDRKNERDIGESPRITGLRFSGELRRKLEYRLDLVIESGTRTRQDEFDGDLLRRRIDAEALDARIVYRPRIKLDPTFILGYAYGSGDASADLPASEQPETPDHSFRQSGLHRNRARDHGTVSYRYYGEVLDPELTNLRILTVGLAMRPVRAFSMDAIYHRYRQDVASSRLRHVDIKYDPQGSDPDLGDGIDLAIGYEPGQRLELRLTAGVFRPGQGFAEEASTTTTIRFQTKFRF